jgi:DtxR family Mn-dependent transcriptional regulator
MPDPRLALLAGLLAVGILMLVFYPDRGLLGRWKARRRPSREILRQDTLKFLLQCELDQRPATRDDVAARLRLEGRETGSLLAALVSDGMLTETDDRLQLTPAGREAASQVLRAHRLWERHLADQSGYADTEWHALADEREHRLTSAEAEALAHDLGQPARDPHGDPIPTARGDVVLHPGVPLRSLPPGTRARVTHVEDEPVDLFDAIAAAGITVDTLIRLVEVAADHVVIQVNGDRYSLPLQAVDNLAVVAVAEEAEVEPAGQPLYDLLAGEQGRVVGISPRCRGAERRRFLDLGILPGTMIEAVMTSPGGDPTAYRIRDALIALRREQARLIRISREPEPQA